MKKEYNQILLVVVLVLAIVVVVVVMGLNVEGVGKLHLKLNCFQILNCILSMRSVFALDPLYAASYTIHHKLWRHCQKH